jgi:hypothetical protein
MLQRPALKPKTKRARRRAQRQLANARKRLCRTRRRAGRLVVRTVLDEYLLIKVLLYSTRVTETESLQRAQVLAAAAELLEEFIHVYWAKKIAEAEAMERNP